MARPVDASLADTLLAARLFVSGPQTFGGMVLRGFGPVRDALLDQMLDALARHRPLVRIPINVDNEQLLGGLDLTATLATGRSTRRAGLIERARGGVVVLAMAERTSAMLAAQLAQAVDNGDLAMILLDDGLDIDEAPPSCLLERAAFHCDLAGARQLDFRLGPDCQTSQSVRALRKDQRSAIATTARGLGISSIRPVVYAQRCALMLARMREAQRIGDEDLQSAMRLVFAPRVVMIPDVEVVSPAKPEPTPNEGDSEAEAQDRDPPDLPLDDLLLQAAMAAIPRDILASLAKGVRRTSGGQAGKSGQKEQSARRGRPRGSVAGLPGDGRRLALLDTLRAAAPWQTLRRREAGADARTLLIGKSDLRIRRFEQNRESLTIFAVDASGSSALSRLAEAKGAVELMLAEAHVKRSQVALVAFRQAQAEVLLPPTRSLTRARRAMSALPGGGGTPLAAGLREARALADAALKRGQTPMIAVLTDGKGNVTLDGRADRSIAMGEVADMAKGIANAGHHAIVIDISPRPREEAETLAAQLRGRYLPLPYANSAALVAAIETVAGDR